MWDECGMNRRKKKLVFVFHFWYRNCDMSMWDECGILFLLFGPEIMICQSNAYGGGEEVAAKQRCNCFQVFLQIYNPK